MENPTAGVTTPPKKPEEIEREMAQTRESITEKVAALETQVMGTIQTATDTVTGTVEAVKNVIDTAPTAVKDTVKETVQAVKESVQKTVSSIDVGGCVRRNPWAALGTSFAGGFALGFLFGGGRTGGNPMRLGSHLPASGGRAGLAAVPQAAAAEQTTDGGFLGGMFGNLFGGVSETIGKELRHLAEVAMASASTAVKQAIDTQVPNLIQSAVPQVVNRVTGNGHGASPRMSDGSGV